MYFTKSLTEHFVLAVGPLVVGVAVAAVAVQPVHAGAAVQTGAAGALVHLRLAPRPFEAGGALAEEGRGQGEARGSIAAWLTKGPTHICTYLSLANLTCSNSPFCPPGHFG